MERRNLWDIGCPLMDAVLWTTFTWEEVRTFTMGHAFEVDHPLSVEGVSKPAAVMTAIHHACHSRSSMSELLHNLLDEIHHEAIDLVERATLPRIRSWCHGDIERLPCELPGFLWAVATDPRPGVGALREWFVWRVQTEGLRRLAFGNVELVRV